MAFVSIRSWIGLELFSFGVKFIRTRRQICIVVGSSIPRCRNNCVDLGNRLVVVVVIKLQIGRQLIFNKILLDQQQQQQHHDIK